jgi:hypothetical protein
MLQWYILCACRILHILVALNLYQHTITVLTYQVIPASQEYFKDTPNGTKQLIMQ